VSYRIVPAETPEDMATFRGLLEEYGRTLDVSSAVQSVAQDCASLPGPYLAPRGALLLAFDHEEPAGCVAMRPRGGDICEMKRLYVRPQCRGAGLGQALAMRIIEEARNAGYRAMRLDTLGSMTAARALYRQLGFREIEPYTEAPLPTASHMELIL